MIKFFGAMFPKVFGKNIDSENVFLLGAEHCLPLRPGILEHAKELARTRCASNAKLSYVFGQVITQLRPETTSEVESIFTEHQESLAERYPVGTAGWSPVEVRKFVKALAVGVELPHKNEEYLYVSTHNVGEWHFLRFYDYVWESEGRKKYDYSLAWIEFNGLRVTANGDRSSIKEITLFAEGEPSNKLQLEAQIGRGLRYACETLLHVSALPSEFLSAMQDPKKYNEFKVNTAGVEISYRTSTGYYRPADRDLTAIFITLRKNS